MSQKLRSCIQQNKVVVHNRTSGEVTVYFPLPDGSPTAVHIPPSGNLELVPKYTTAAMIAKSNLEELARHGRVSFL